MFWARIECLDVSDNSVIGWFLASILLKIWILNDLRCFVAFWFCREIYGKKIWIRISQIQYGGGGLHFVKVFHKIPVFFKRWLPLDVFDWWWFVVTLTIMKILVRLIATRRAQIKVRAPEKRQKQRRASAFGKLWKCSPARTWKLWKRDSVWTDDDRCQQH